MPYDNGHINHERALQPRRSACSVQNGPSWLAWLLVCGLFVRLGPVRELVGIGGVVAALSVASDLTRGHPPGEAMRACLLATELARRAGLDRVRQGEVYYGTLLRFAGCAATSHEIAAELVISPSTVHTHTVHIYAKCGVSTRAALAMFAMRHGLAGRTG